VHDIIQSEQRADAVLELINSTITELSVIDEWLNSNTNLLSVYRINIENGKRCTSYRSAEKRRACCIE
jgi:hypothetical protein